MRWEDDLLRLAIFRYDHLALILANALRKSPISASLVRDWTPFDAKFEQSTSILHYPVLSSDLRSVETGESLNMMKIHLQLLQVRRSIFLLNSIKVDCRHQSPSRESLKPNDYRINAVPNLMDMAHYCSCAGYGLHTNEMMLYVLTMQIESLKMSLL